MDIALVILAFILLVVGLAGCVLPVIPGPPLAYAGVLLLQWSGHGDFTPRFLIILGLVVAAVTVIDLILPSWLTKKFGGSRSAVIGATVGLILGLFILPGIGIILFPFLGALAGSLISDRTNNAKAFKVAFASFGAFMLGTGMKLAVTVFMIVYCVRAFFV